MTKKSACEELLKLQDHLSYKTVYSVPIVGLKIERPLYVYILFTLFGTDLNY